MQVLNYGDSMATLPLGDIVAYGAPGSTRQSVVGTPFSEDEDKPSKLLIAAELEPYEELAKRPFAEGGPPVSAADWESLGLDLSRSINPGVKSIDGSYIRRLRLSGLTIILHLSTLGKVWLTFAAHRRGL